MGIMQKLYANKWIFLRWIYKKLEKIEMNAKVTYICVFNDKMQLNDMLIKSLHHVNVRDNFSSVTLLIDNTKSRYASCAEAYNKEITRHLHEMGDILIFLHQDIAFDNNEFERRIVEELESDPNQIVGFAGMPRSGKTVSNLKYQKTKKYITSTQIREKTEVLSLDECCFAMTKELYLKLRFDERACSHWHLYAVDICYEAKRRFGTTSYVLPETIYHKCDGTSGLFTDHHFLWTMWKLIRKYRHDYTSIYAPCYIVSTKYNAALVRLFRSVINNMIRK